MEGMLKGREDEIKDRRLCLGGFASNLVQKLFEHEPDQWPVGMK